MGMVQKFYTISQETIDYIISEAAKAGTQAGITAYRSEHEKATDKVDKTMIANVREILKTYRSLQNDLIHSQYDTEPAQKELRFKCVEDLMNPGETHMDDVMSKEIERLKRNAWSKRQIERAVDLLKEDCESRKLKEPEAMRKYRVIMALYIQDDPVDVLTLAEAEFVTERTIHRDISDACKMMAPYLLNIDKIHDLLK